MSNNVFAAKALTGGSAGSLDDIDDSVLTDGDVAIVAIPASKYLYFYTYDADGVAAESSPDVVNPDSGTGNWLLTYMQSYDSFYRTPARSTSLGEYFSGIGVKYERIWIPAGAMIAKSTNGAEYGESETWDNGTNDNMRKYYAFDKDTDEFVNFSLVMPETWDRSTIKFKPYFTGLTGVSSGETACFALSGVAIGNNDDLDADQGTAQTSTDTFLDDDSDVMHIGPASNAITIAGSPAVGDEILLELYRDVSEDNAGGDVALLGIVIEIAHTNSVSAWS